MKKYSPEFKQQALDMITTDGFPRTAELLDIPESTLHRWKRSIKTKLQEEPIEIDLTEKTAPVIPAAEIDEEPTSAENDSDDDELDTIALLMAENAKLRKTNLQLRKALAALIE